jgi:hypothetical protein
MAIDFPSSPAANEIYEENDLSWRWNGTSWDALVDAYTAPPITLGAGSEDYLSVSSSEITGNPIDLDNLSATGTPSATTFLRGDNSWATPAGGSSPEGTDVLSTGETGGTKFLREDGDGTCSWQTPSTGGGGGLTLVDKTADANITAVNGEMHVVEMNSGTPFTASRNWTLPVAASVATGDQFGLMIKDGDASFEVNVRTGATGDLLNGVDISASSNEWELFQAGEVLIITCIDGATGDYIVERDGRKKCAAKIQKTSAQTLVGATYDQVEYDTEAYNFGMTTNVTTTYDITVRRAGLYKIDSHTIFSDSELLFTNQDFLVGRLYIDGVTTSNFQQGSVGAASTNRLGLTYDVTL